MNSQDAKHSLTTKQNSLELTFDNKFNLKQIVKFWSFEASEECARQLGYHPNEMKIIYRHS